MKKKHTKKLLRDLDKADIAELFTEKTEQEETLFATEMKMVAPCSPSKIIAPISKKYTKNTVYKSFHSFSVTKECTNGENWVKGYVEKDISKAKVLLSCMQKNTFRFAHKLDMHGMRIQTAHNALMSFMHQAYCSCYSTVLIITGKGKNSPIQGGILHEAVTEWLTQYPLQEIVLSFTTPSKNNGGSGAIAVSLQEYNSNKKLMWNTQLPTLF